MLPLTNRLYFSAFVNSFGSWLTFLAIALIVKEKLGADHVAFVFLAQTLPAILFSRVLSDLVPEKRQGQAYLLIQFLLAANSFILCLTQNIWAIYAHLFCGAILKSVANPLFNSLIARLVPRAALQSVFTRIGALQAGTLALAPVLGAWLKINSSVEILFATDAFTFVAAALIVPEFLKTIGIAESVRKTVQFWNNFITPPEGIPRATYAALKSWLIFLTVGALLNAIEFPAFARIHMSDQEIGFAMAAWGGGSLLAMVLPVKRGIVGFSLTYFGSLLAFALAPTPWILIASFAVAGLFSSVLSGALRALLQFSVPQDFNPLPLWAFTNQLTQVLNLIAYASVGALLRQTGLGPFAALTLGAAGWIVIASNKIGCDF